MQGRPRKSSAQHELDGTYRADRHGAKVAQFRAEGYPERPAKLSRAAAALWDHLIKDLNVVAARIDSTTLAGLCEWYAVYRANSEALTKLKPTSCLYGRVLKQQSTAWSAFERIAGQFGLTPSMRARLQVKPAEQKGGIVTRMRAKA